MGDRNRSPTDPRWFLAGGTGAPTGLLHLLSILAQETQARAELWERNWLDCPRTQFEEQLPSTCGGPDQECQAHPIYKRKKEGCGIYREEGERKAGGASEEPPLPPAKEAQPLRAPQGLQSAQAGFVES